MRTGEEARSVGVEPTLNTGSSQGTTGGSSNPSNPPNPNNLNNPNEPETPARASVPGRVTDITGNSIDIVVDGTVVSGSQLNRWQMLNLTAGLVL